MLFLFLTYSLYSQKDSEKIRSGELDYICFWIRFDEDKICQSNYFYINGNLVEASIAGNAIMRCDWVDLSFKNNKRTNYKSMMEFDSLLMEADLKDLESGYKELDDKLYYTAFFMKMEYVLRECDVIYHNLFDCILVDNKYLYVLNIELNSVKEKNIPKKLLLQIIENKDTIIAFDNLIYCTGY